MKRRHGLHRMRAADRLDARFGQTEVTDLAFANEVLDRTGDVLDRDVRIDAMLIKEIDPVRLEAFQRGLGDVPDVRRAAVVAGLLPVFELEAELGRNDDLIANGPERFTDTFLVGERAVGFGGVEEGDTQFNGCADDGDAILALRCGAVAKA